MSDLLDRLIARGRGDVPTVSPRLPGLFEDDAGAAVPVQAEEEGVVWPPSAIEGETASPHAAVTATSAPDPLPRPAARAVESRVRSEQIEREPTVVHVEHLEPPLAPPPSRPADVAKQPTLPARPPSIEAEPSKRPRSTADVADSPAWPPPGRHGEPTLPAGDAAMVPPAPTVSPAPTLAAAPPQEIVPAPATSTAPPRVEVRIGRIEVRGGPTEAPATHARAERRLPRGPRTSLDDYLRRRREQ